jgi:hypothetical protein
MVVTRRVVVVQFGAANLHYYLKIIYNFRTQKIWSNFVEH